MDKRKLKRELYYHLEKKYEKNKIIRIICASLLIAIIYCLLFYNRLNEMQNIEEILLFIVGMVITSFVDIFVHIIIFHFTLDKNKEESIELERLRNEIEKD